MWLITAPDGKVYYRERLLRKTRAALSTQKYKVKHAVLGELLAPMKRLSGHKVTTIRKQFASRQWTW